MSDPVASSASLCLVSSDALAYGISIALGVVAGAVVQYLLGIFVGWLGSRRVARGAKFELGYIAETKVPEWRAQLAELRRRIAEGRTEGYVNFFDLARLPTGALNAYIQSGRAYSRLGAEGLSSLLELLSGLTLHGQQQFNERASEARDNANQQSAFTQLDFLDWKINDFHSRSSGAKKNI